MIRFVNKPSPQPSREDNRFEQIRQAAAAGHRKSDTRKRESASRAVEDDKLI